MSAARHVLGIGNKFGDLFVEEFGFYLDSVDKLFDIQSATGLSEDVFVNLPEETQDAFKAVLILVQQSNAITTGALRLLSGNSVAEAYLSLRALYETAALLHYGNVSTGNAGQVSRLLFLSLDGEVQRRAEKAVVRRAVRRLESDHPGFAGTRKELDRYGPGISRERVLLSVRVFGGETTTATLINQFHSRQFLMVIDLLHNLFSFIVKKFLEFTNEIEPNGNSSELLEQLKVVDRQFLQQARPALQAKRLDA